jgi:hypothetical protein
MEAYAQRALVLISFFILPKYRCIVFRFSSAENLAKKLHYQLLVVSNIGVQFIPPTRCFPETSVARRSADSPVCREFIAFQRSTVCHSHIRRFPFPILPVLAWTGTGAEQQGLCCIFPPGAFLPFRHLISAIRPAMT